MNTAQIPGFIANNIREGVSSELITTPEGWPQVVLTRKGKGAHLATVVMLPRDKYRCEITDVEGQPARTVMYGDDDNIAACPVHRALKAARFLS